jgi:hypothetical protein
MSQEKPAIRELTLTNLRDLIVICARAAEAFESAGETSWAGRALGYKSLFEVQLLARAGVEPSQSEIDGMLEFLYGFDPSTPEKFIDLETGELLGTHAIGRLRQWLKEQGVKSKG